MLGKDRYRLLYQNELEKEAEWLKRGAVEKVNSVQLLLKRNQIIPENLLELGCGVGAVITECQRRNLATRYTGVDYSPEALDYLRAHSEGIESIQGDITAADFHIGNTFDVLLLSHVLEHLEKPAIFLGAVKNLLKFRYIIIEVPLEDLIANRIKSVLRDKKYNKAGHIQFFNVRIFEQLLNSNGFKIIDRRTYLPILDVGTIRFVSEKDGLPRLHCLLKILTSHYLPRMLRPLWKNLYYAHHAVLCVPD
jgi:SAM-dependent methyltransferase